MPATKTRAFRPTDVSKQAMIQGVAISPDGTQVVYARRTVEKGTYRSRLWSVPVRGGRATQLTFTDASDGRPRFSPDGRSLLFISDREGKTPQVWVMATDGGEPRQLTHAPDGAAGAEWSPDGSKVLFLAGSGEQRFLVGKKDDPTARAIRDTVWRLDGVGIRDERTSVWVVSAVGRTKPVRVTRPAVDTMHAFWSPDGARIGFISDPRPDPDFEVPQAWSVPARGGRERPLASLPGGVWGAAWSVAGLAVAGVRQEDPMGWERFIVHVRRGSVLVPIDDGLEEATAQLATYGDLLDPTMFLPELAWLDERSVVAAMSLHGRSHVYRFDLDGTITPLTDGDIVCTALATGGGRTIVTANIDANAGEVYEVRQGSAPRRLTTNGSRWYAPFHRVPEQIVLRHREGHEVEGWLLRARGRTRAPLVLNVHGGPHAAHNPTPWMEMLALQDAGMHVVWTNPRGSTSYGEAFGRAIDGEWGGEDGTDQMLFVDWAIRHGLTERRRVGILGLSYGGFMVHWMLGHYPGRFAAGVSENPVSDLTVQFGASDYGVVIARMATAQRRPSDSFERWLERSPSTLLNRNEAPLLLLQCESDLRCPPANSEISFATMKSLGREVEMVRYPGEPHGMFITGRTDRRIDRLERIVAWFGTHL